jgi:hypothetical protein
MLYCVSLAQNIYLNLWRVGLLWEHDDYLAVHVVHFGFRLFVEKRNQIVKNRLQSWLVVLRTIDFLLVNKLVATQRIGIEKYSFRTFNS